MSSVFMPEAEIGQVQPVPAQLAHRPDGVVEAHAVLVEVVGAEAHGQRQALRPDRADGVHRLAVEAQAVLQAAAVFIRAPVRQRGEEAGAEVAMREMHLQPFEAGRQRAARGLGIGAVQVVDLGDRQFVHRVGVAPAIGDGGGAAHLPAIRVVRRELRLAVPGLLLAALAARVPELDRRHRAHVLDDAR